MIQNYINRLNGWSSVEYGATAGQTSPLSFLVSGYYYKGVPNEQARNGSYWMSTFYSARDASRFTLPMGYHGIEFGSNDRNFGFSIRCLAR